MQTPPLPHDEANRVAELQSLGILDSLPEERFDRYTRLVKRLLDVPIVLVSLVDTNRQWFKSRQGLEACETSRDISFCGHAILGQELFVIEDASADERFCDNPLVTDDPHIRFYAGYPLAGPGGHNMGTLCVIDRTPRQLTPDDLEALKDIGAMVADELASLKMATTDDLTGISNRRGFEMLAEHALALCCRTATPASVAMIDMDGFKSINDQFGHDEGDRALVDFAEMMRAEFRESDVVARLGGDEFCALLTSADEVQGWRALERLQETVDRRNMQSDSRYPLAFSGGVARFRPEEHDNIAATLCEADAGMYARKPLRMTRKSR